MVNLPRLGASLVLSALVCAGCALINRAQPRLAEAIETSDMVRMCARETVAMAARDLDRDLPIEAALAFCAALEASDRLTAPGPAL